MPGHVVSALVMPGYFVTVPRLRQIFAAQCSNQLV
jgi:hypothetical protein